MPLVENRYADALADIAVKSGNIELFKEQARLILSLYDTQEDLKTLLTSHEVDSTVKKNIIKSIFKDNTRNELVNFLLLLVDKGRVSHLPGIIKEFEKMANDRSNVLTMKIISASPLEDKQINRIKEKYRNIYNAVSVSADIKVDSSLLGGVKVVVDDKVFDGTVKGRLEELRKMIVKI
jgi:F-type H+-transporting ATPase subunit delta